MEAVKLTDAATIKLVKRCKADDGDAYNELLSRYEGYLYRICYSFTRSKEESLDMMQEVYIKVFRSIKDFDETRPILPWLKKITVNTLINHGKKNRGCETSLEGKWEQMGCRSGGIAPEDYLVAKNVTEEDVIYNDTREAVEKMMEELPEHYRLALFLRYHDEMSYEQIAGVLEQPLGTVKNSIFRARSQLREKMLACGLLEV